MGSDTYRRMVRSGEMHSLHSRHLLQRVHSDGLKRHIKVYIGPEIDRYIENENAIKILQEVSYKICFR